MSKRERDDCTMGIISRRNTEAPSVVLLHSMRNSDAGQLADKDLQVHFAFKTQLVHGYLRFAMFVALRYALHRSLGRDIERQKSTFEMSTDLIARLFA